MWFTTQGGMLIDEGTESLVFYHLNKQWDNNDQLVLK